jgi:hypothetical protein
VTAPSTPPTPIPPTTPRLFERAQVTLAYENGMPVVTIGAGDEARVVPNVYRAMLVAESGYQHPQRLVLWLLQPDDSPPPVTTEAEVIDIHEMQRYQHRLALRIGELTVFSRRLATECVRQATTVALGKDAPGEMDLYTVAAIVDNAALAVGAQTLPLDENVGAAVARAWILAEQAEGVVAHAIATEVDESTRTMSTSNRYLVTHLAAAVKQLAELLQQYGTNRPVLDDEQPPITGEITGEL